RVVPIFEYSPRKIKQSVTGSGSASKEQVAAMLQTLLNFKETPEFLDATDGLAVAVCHSFQQNTSAGSKSYSGWSAFVKDNQSRVRQIFTCRMTFLTLSSTISVMDTHLW